MGRGSGTVYIYMLCKQYVMECYFIPQRHNVKCVCTTRGLSKVALRVVEMLIMYLSKCISNMHAREAWIRDLLEDGTAGGPKARGCQAR